MESEPESEPEPELESCSVFEFSLWELFFPSKLVVRQLCMPYDKTYLFIYSVLRCVIYIVLFNMCMDTYGESDIFTIIWWIIICFNMIMLLIVMNKKTRYAQNPI